MVEKELTTPVPAAEVSSSWFSRTELGDGITMVSEPWVHPYLRANVFHLRGRDRDLVVDTGMGLAPLRSALALPQGKPALAVATHIHLDHVGSLHEFTERAGPAISAESLETMPDTATYESAIRTLDRPVTRLPRPGWSASAYRLVPAPLTVRLGEGDIIDLGDRCLSVLQLPGHSPDSIALLDEVDGLFFSGDAIYDDELIDTLPDSDRVAYRASMRRILTLPVRRGFGGHGPSFDGKRMREIATAYLAQPD